MTWLPLDNGSKVLGLVVARIGDTLLATPALRALGAAAGHLTVLAHPQRKEVLEHLDFIDELGQISKRSAWLRGRLGRSQYDAAFCWGRDIGLLRYCLRSAKQCVAFDYPEFNGIRSAALLRVPVAKESSLHAVEERMLLVSAAGVTPQGMGLSYSVSVEEQRFAMAWLAKQGLSGARPLIGLQPCSFPTKSHRDWPIESFAALLDRIGKRYPEARMLVLGDAASRARAKILKNVFPERVTLASGQLALRQSAALMQQLDLYIGVDTGPTHIAGALGLPMTVLYHPRYPSRNLIPLANSRCAALEADTEDMGSISVDQVWSSVCRHLA